MPNSLPKKTPRQIDQTTKSQHQRDVISSGVPGGIPEGVPEGILDAVGRIRGLETEIAAVIREMQEKVRQLELLNGFSSLMNSTLDTQQVREKALEATCQLLRCETASLFLIDTKTGELYWETALGETGKELQKSVRLPIDDRSIAGYVAMTGESVMLNDVQADPRHFKKSAKSTPKISKDASPQGFVSRTMVCVPLKSKDRIIGVLQALNKLPEVPEKLSTHTWPDFSKEDQKLLETLSHQVSIAIENSKLYSDIKKSFFETVEALAEAIEKKDRYTGGHTKRVVYYSMCIAKYMNLSPETLEQLRMGAILHDVGKIGIEDKILKKQAPLDKEEWEIMQKHPEIGFDIMGRVEGLKDIVSAMRYHHERWDGNGYPYKLKGEEIPLIARVVSVADTYDAMVSTRPYRKGMDPKIAFDEITKYSGTQFCPTVVTAFVEAFKHEKMGKGSGGWTGNSLSNCD
jgi:HD-GYP domain-containing protein (c-di-GMP phosphodiesterase class II)